LRSTAETWCSTVLGETSRRAAISALLKRRFSFGGWSNHPTSRTTIP
jgi:hypothetical protein